MVEIGIVSTLEIAQTTYFLIYSEILGEGN